MPSGALLWPQLSEGRLGDLRDLKLEVGNSNVKRKIGSKSRYKFDLPSIFFFKAEKLCFWWNALGNHFLMQTETEIHVPQPSVLQDGNAIALIASRRVGCTVSLSVVWGW